MTDAQKRLEEFSALLDAYEVALNRGDAVLSASLRYDIFAKAEQMLTAVERLVEEAELSQQLAGRYYHLRGAILRMRVVLAGQA